MTLFWILAAMWVIVLLIVLAAVATYLTMSAKPINDPMAIANALNEVVDSMMVPCSTCGGKPSLWIGSRGVAEVYERCKGTHPECIRKGRIMVPDGTTPIQHWNNLQKQETL